MKQFSKILKFELMSYMKNKVFMGITIFLVVALAIVMFFPRFLALADNEVEVPDDGTTPPLVTDEELPLMLILSQDPEQAPVICEAFSAAFQGYRVELATKGEDEVKEMILNGEAECAFLLDSQTSYTYFVNNLSMYDSNTVFADEILQNLYRMNAMVGGGMSYEDASSILSAQITGEIVSLGKDQMQNFFYTYIMIFALYMVILLYGQMVATNVATEKSSRAMEVLITSAKPVNMMFGKVIASCLAGLIQLVAVFGSALVFYQLNRSYWGENIIVDSIFNIPLDLFFFMLLFFILGFFIYAFLYGAIGSTASKLEDINTSVMPITLLFVIGFMVVVFSMSAGDVDNSLMKICSFVPFTSPMAMFTRIAMSTVPWYEIAISVVILIASVIAVGVISAKIYRIGVLLYGTPPKLGAIIKAIRKA